MKNNFYILVLFMIILAGCKSNPEVYNTTYRKLKDKEEAMMDANAKTAMKVPKSVFTNDSTGSYLTEKLNLILGNEVNFSTYNIVARSFINRTNARGYYSQMVDNGFPAALVQNEDMMYRIIIASFLSMEDAQNRLKEISKAYPEAYILIRIL